MSILAAAASATDPQAVTVVQLAWAGGLIALAAIVGYFLGVYRRGSISGPIRPGPETNVSGILVLVVVGFITWFGMQFVYLTARAVNHRMSGDPEPFTAAMFTPMDFSILATIPYVVGFLVLAIGDRLSKPTLPGELGWSLDKLAVGAGGALLAMLCVLPLMSAASIILEALYQAVGYKHPTEHELLTVLGRAHDPITKWLIIGGATLLAPVFEEFLFRGHIQTLLVRAFSPRPVRPSLAGFAVVQDAVPVPMVVGDPPIVVASTASPDSSVPILPPPEPAEPARPPSPMARWGAIAITSILFAVLHPAWTWPLIFLLSLALGYAYERTGNLWVAVGMHLVFNTFNTFLFLHMRPL